MSRYQVLVQERADLVAEGRGIIAAAESENRGLTADEATRDDAINARLDEIAGDLTRIERDRERQRLVEAVPHANGAAALRSITGLHDRREDDPRAGWSSLAEFAVAVRKAFAPGGSAVIDERLLIGAAPSDYFQETGGTSGEGYMVPPEFRQTIWQIVWQDPLLSRVSFENTSSNSVGLLADESTPWGSTGIVARWRSEASQMTAQKFSVEPRLTRLHELYAFVLATGELLQDAALIRSRMSTKASEAIAWKAAEAILTGTGAGQPLGIMNADALVTIAKETNQVAKTVVAENVLSMLARLIAQGSESAFWLGNSDILPQLPTMTIGTQPVWLPPNGLAGTPNGGMLLGKPLILTEHAETLGTKGDLILFNPAGYHAIRRTTEPEFASSIHLYFDYNIEAFRWTFRLGGQPFLSAPISPAKGSNTKSHFVVLAARA